MTMRIYFANHPNFETSDDFCEIKQGAHDYRLRNFPDAGLQYFRLVNVPSACTFTLSWLGYQNRPWVIITFRTTHYTTTTGVIDSLSAHLHPDPVIAPGLERKEITVYDHRVLDSVYHVKTWYNT